MHKKAKGREVSQEELLRFGDRVRQTGSDVYIR